MMLPDGKLRAWIETRNGKLFAAFVGVANAPGQREATNSRPPAMQLCSSADEAKRWVQNEAKALDLPVEWVGGS